MIAGIHGSGHVTVTGGQPYYPYITSSEYPTTVEGRPCYNGDVRYMGGSYQIFNNGIWTSSSVHAQLTLAPEIEEVLIWARVKMWQERELEELMKKHESIKDTKLQLDVLVALLKDQNA